MECDRGEDRGLGGGVVALYICCGIGFGIAQTRGLGQGLRVIGAGGSHLGEDVVGGAVDDADHAFDLVTGHRTAQWADHRDRPGHRRLEVQIGAGGIRGVREFVGVLGEKCLVGGDDGLSLSQCVEEEGSWHVDATHEFDDDVDVVPHHQRCRICGEQFGVEPTVLAQVSYGHTTQFERCADSGGERLRVLGHEADDLGADRAHTEHRHSHGSHA